MSPLITFPFIAAALVLTAAAVYFTVFRRELQLQSRSEAYVGVSERSVTPEKKNAPPPVLHSLWEKGIEFTNRYITSSEQKKVELLLRDAGYMKKKTAVEFRFTQLASGLVSGGAGVLLFSSAAGELLPALFVGLVMAVLGFRLPVFYLKKQRDKRVKKIQLEMPDFFDTVNLLIEAGVGVDAAISSVCYKKPGPLSDEFLIVLDDMKRGKSKREAFQDLKRRVPSQSFQSVVTSMIQADELGIGMSNVLRNLTARIREQRRESAREQAMKAPVKMLFPMVLFIFPALFMVILGPFAVDIFVNGLF
jgi:tight adherence protein C